MGQGDGQEVAWLEVLVDLVRRVHDQMLEIGGGAPGEHTASLYSACARPFQSAFGELIYDGPYERAAAIAHAIICDHVFVDGNKRTGTASALLFLFAEGVLPDPAEDEHLRLSLLGEVALATASGGLDIDGVTYWLRRIFEVPDARGDV
jgi:death-on-curing protein